MPKKKPKTWTKVTAVFYLDGKYEMDDLEDRELESLFYMTRAHYEEIKKRKPRHFRARGRITGTEILTNEQ